MASSYGRSRTLSAKPTLAVSRSGSRERTSGSRETSPSGRRSSLTNSSSVRARPASALSRTALSYEPSSPGPNDPGTPGAGPGGAASKVTVTGPGLVMAAPSTPMNFTVDLTSLKKKYTTSDIRVDITGPCKPSKLDVQDQRDGTFVVVYVMAMSGKYKISVTIGSTVVGTYMVACNQPYTDPGQCVLLNGRVPSAFFNERFYLSFEANDQFGNRLKSGGEVFSAKVLDGDTTLFEAEIEDEGDGQYTASFIPEVAGEYRLDIGLGGKSITGSPFNIVVRKDETVAYSCKALGGGLSSGRAGESNTFTIQAVDGKHNARRIGGDKFKVSIATDRSGEPMVGKVVDHMDGSYTVTWTSTISGSNIVSILLDGDHIHGSPYTAVISPDKLDPASCDIWGPGLKSVVAGAPAIAFLRARDTHGNLREEGVDTTKFNCFMGPAGRKVTAAGGIEGRVEAVVGSGCEYKVTFVATLTGDYAVTAFVDAKPVKGTPAHCTVVPGEVDVHSSRLYGPGLERVILGKPSLVYVELADTYGNRVDVLPDQHFDVRVEGGPSGHVPVVPAASETGMLAVSYTAKSAGSYIVSARYNNVHLARSPATVVASTANACPGLCEVRLIDDKTEAADVDMVAGQPTHFLIHAKDANAVLKSIGGDQFIVTAIAPDKSKMTGKVIDNGNGTYTASLTGTTAGAHTISVCVKDEPVSGSPFSAKVRAAGVCTSSTVLLGNVAAIEAGQAATLVIKPHDAYSNSIARPSFEDFVLKASGPGETDVTVNAHGEVRVSATTAGLYTISCLYDGGHCKHSPYSLEVEAAPACAGMSAVVNAPKSNAVAGLEEEIQVATRDQFGNPAVGRDSVSILVENHLGGTVTVPAKGTGAGKYAAQLAMPTLAGLLTYTVMVNGSPVETTPATIQVVPAPPTSWALLGTAEAKLGSCVAGVATAMVLQVQDAHGNHCLEGGADVSVVLEQAAGDDSLELSAPSSPASHREKKPRVSGDGRDAPSPRKDGKAHRRFGSSDLTTLSISASGNRRSQSTSIAVRDRSDGTYEATLTPKRVGEFTVKVSLAGAVLRNVSYPGRCLPGRTDVEKCVIQGGGETVVGQKGTIRIVCCDHYGNPISTHVEGDVRFRAESNRLGSMTTTLQERPSGDTEVTYEASVAGEYTISLSCAETGTMVPGSPRTVLILPDEVHAAMCEATVTKTAGTAGETLAVQVELRDKFGNPLPDNTQGLPEVTVVAHGSSEVVLTPTGTGLVFEAAMKQAGSYVVQALVAGKSVRGWPRIEQIAPAAVAPGKTQVGGSALARPLVCGTPSQVVVQTMDAFRNACTKGGADLEVVLVLEGGDNSDKDLKPVAGVVTDCKDGTYAVDVVVNRAGDWRLEVTVGGEAVRTGGFKVASMFGPPTAKDCLVTKSVTKAVCGRTDTVQVRAGGAGGPRSFSDTEGLGMNMVAPSGVSHRVDLEFREDGVYAEWAVEWVEAGKHTLNVTLGGVHVKGSPIVVEAEAEEICLANSTIGRPEMLDAVAGERAIVTIEAKDVKGNRMVTKGTKMSIEGAAGTVQAGGVECTGPGQHKAWFVVTKAGPYEVDIVVEDTKERFSICGRCVAGRTDVEKCVLHGSGSYVVAGQKGSLQVVRYDKAGNLVTNAAGDVEIRVNCSGPGQMGHVLLERDQGGLEVQYSATAEGTYTLTLTSGETGAQLKGSPCKVCIVPGELAKDRCQATLVGEATVLTAGQDLKVVVEPQDMFGNVLKRVDPERITIVAEGPMQVQLLLSDPAGSKGKAAAAADGKLTFKGAATRAGSYILQVLVDSRPVSGWTRVLQVVPGSVSASHCYVGMDAVMVCGTPSLVMVQAVDPFGNSCTKGNEKVKVVLTGKKGKQRVEAPVGDNGDGSYSATATVASAGNWNLQVLVNGLPVRESGCDVEAVYGPLIATDCTVQLADGDHATCGAAGRVQVHAGAASGETRRLSGKEGLRMHVNAPSGANHKVDMVVMEGGSFSEGKVQWVETGPHTVKVTLDGGAVPGSPFAVEVGPAALDPQQCYLANPRAEMRCDVPETLELQLFDRFRNPCAITADRVTVSSTPSAAVRSLGVRANSSGPTSAHTLHLDLTPLLACRALIEVRVDGVPIMGAPMVASIAPGAMALDMCQVRGSGVSKCVAGVAAVFVLEARDQGGNRLAEGGVHFTAVLSGEGKGQVRDRNDGTYEVTYVREEAGEFTITLQLPSAAGDTGDSTIKFPVVCSAGPTDVGRCEVTLPKAPSLAGQAGALKVQRYDRFGNTVAATETQLKATGSGPGPMTTQVLEKQTGCIEVLFNARVSGAYKIAVISAETGLALSGSPFAVVIAPGPVEPASCRVRLMGSSSTVVAGAEAGVVVERRDRYGNMATDSAGDSCVGKATAPGLGTVDLLQVEGAAGMLAAPLTVAGKYTLQVFIKTALHAPIGTGMGDLTVNVIPGPVWPRATLFENVPKQLTAGTVHDITIVPRDRHGNVGATEAVVRVDLQEAGQTQPRACQVARNGLTGMYKSTLGVRTMGAAVLRVWVSNETGAGGEEGEGALEGASPPLLDSFVTVVEGEPCYEESSIGEFLPECGAIVGHVAGFNVTARDANGNQQGSGGDRFEVEMTGKGAGRAVEVVVEDLKNGTYAARYVVGQEGMYTVSVRLAGEHVKGSPSNVVVFKDVKKLAEQEMEKRLAHTVASLRSSISEARQIHRSLKSESASLASFIPVLVESTKNGVHEALAVQNGLLEESRANFQREAVERKRLHNMVQELKGNIRVFCRVKPLSEEEIGEGIRSCVKVREDGRSIACGQHSFEFDRAFGPRSTQEDLFEDVSGLVTSVLDGYNVCVFAYGQTGAGKTWTMEGPPDTQTRTEKLLGVNYRALGALFHCISTERAGDYSYTVSTNMLEVYNEQVYDLLAPHMDGNRGDGLDLISSGRRGEKEGFAAQGVSTVPVETVDEVKMVMKQGFLNRAVGVHDINAHSSRSHCMLVVNVEGVNSSSGLRMSGKLTLCDLAGSERISKTHATGLTLTEAQNINNSLLSLGNVISALVSGGAHVPYRNSKLTMLLQDSLGGDAKALMMCNLAPSSHYASETLASLQFAQKVSSVELRTPRRNLEDVDAEKRKTKWQVSAEQATKAATTAAKTPKATGRPGFLGFGRG